MKNIFPAACLCQTNVLAAVWVIKLVFLKKNVVFCNNFVTDGLRKISALETGAS